MSAEPAAGDGAAPPDPLAVMRSRNYLGLLLMVAALGVPVSAAAFGFLALVQELQSLTYKDLPRALGLHGTPLWWPLPLLAVAGLLTALTIRHLPGTGGHKPAEGRLGGGPPRPVTCRASRSPRWPRWGSARRSGPRHRSSRSAAG